MDFDDVETLLDADMDYLEYEEAELYEQIEYLAVAAGVVDSQGRQQDADYLREVAVDRYEALVDVIQMKKDGDDYDF